MYVHRSVVTTRYWMPCLAMAFIVGAVVSGALAQPPVFAECATPGARTDGEAPVQPAAVPKRAYAKRSRLATPVNAATALRNGELLLNLFDDVHLRITIVRPPQPENGISYLWVGVVEADPTSEALLYYDEDSNSLTGRVTVGPKFYLLDYFGPGVTLVEDADVTKLRLEL